MGYKLKRITMWKEKTITPREPTANTLFYYKFEGDLVNEVTGTADCSFSGTGSYDTVDGVECVNLNNTGLTLSAKLPANDFTLCWYGNFISFAPDTFNGVIGILGTGNNGIHCQLLDDQYSSIGPSLSIYNYATGQGTAAAISDGYTTGQRYCYTLVRSSGVCTLYVNGVSQASITTGGNNSQSVQYYLGEVYNNTRYYHGYMSKAIMENVAWSASDVQTYFNNTKEEYGYPAPSPMLEEKQIRPKNTRTFSYDFSNKTQAQVEADGWTVDLPFNTDSDGWYCSPPGALQRSLPDLTNAKKITVNTEVKLASGSWIGNVGWCVNSGSTAAIYQFVSGNTAGNKGTQIYNNGVLGAWTGTSVSGWANSTLEVDLLTYEIKATVVNNGVTQTATATATAETIETIIAGHQFTTYPDSASHRLKTVQITVEY